MEEPLLNLKEVCRVCLEKGEMISIFELNISRKIMDCTTVQVWPNDGLPEQICTKCSTNLQVSFQFKELCEKSDRRLRLSLTGNQLPMKSESTDDLNPFVQPPQAFNYNSPNLGDAQFGNQSQQQPHEEQNNFDKTENDGICTDLLYPVTQIKTETCFPEDVGDESGGNETSMHTENAWAMEEKQEDYQPSVFQPEEDYSFKPTNGVEQNSDRPFKCDFCDKAYSAKGNLNQHMKTHYGVMYKCDKCDKCFSMEYNLKRHYNIHTGDNLFSCDQCERSFTNKGHLKEHKLVHIDHRPFKCGKCEKSFRRKTHLKQHDKLHTGLRPFECGSCEKKFHQEKDLLRHERMHTGDRPFKCIECEKCFREKEDLMKHIRTHNKKVNKKIKTEKAS